MVRFQWRVGVRATLRVKVDVSVREQGSGSVSGFKAVELGVPIAAGVFVISRSCECTCSHTCTRGGWCSCTSICTRGGVCIRDSGLTRSSECTRSCEWVSVRI